jgi:hypothetical protein
MECPKCKVPCPEGAAVCPACGLIFAKWQAHHAAQASAGPAATPATPTGGLPSQSPSISDAVSEPSDAWVRYGAVILLVAAVAFAAYFLLKPSAPKVDAPRVTPWGVLGGKPAAVHPTQSVPPTPVL